MLVACPVCQEPIGWLYSLASKKHRVNSPTREVSHVSICWLNFETLKRLSMSVTWDVFHEFSGLSNAFVSLNI